MLVLVGACAPPPPPPIGSITLTRDLRTDDVGCTGASPLLVTSQGEDFVVGVAMDGLVRAFDVDTGALAWSIALPVPDGRVANVTSSPVLFDESHLVIAYQHVVPGSFDRDAHRVVVVDLEARALDPSFPAITPSGSRPTWDGTGIVEFSAAHSFSRAALVHVDVPDRVRGLVYVTYGNIRDIQPWHGWIFELDLDAWAMSGAGAAISSFLLTTAEDDCGTPGHTGSEEMVCGGGVWVPAGAGVRETRGGGFELLVPTGNGMLDPNRGQFSNGVLRTGRGLAFTHGCTDASCASWDPTDPALACVESCEDLFVPRMEPDDPPLRPASGRCDGMTMFECWGQIDWDFGASTPVVVDVPGGPEVIVAAAKDGAVYVFDADHFGTLYDRLQIADWCGAAGDTCTAEWAGMIVTEPVVTTLDGAPLLLVPTFEFDRTHAGGVVAVRLAMEEGAPHLTRVWSAPSGDEAIVRFRRHASRPVLTTIGGESVALVWDVGDAATPGRLFAIRVRDGETLGRAELDGPGQRYVRPLVVGDRVWVSSCAPGDGAGHLEAYGMSAVTR
jgi:outer membrane protein assembly factor BamB